MESDVQKTRKVLEYILHKFYDGADGYPHARLNIRDKGMIKSALSKPLRNCDVGTAEEQGKRFQEFCDDSQTDEDFCSMCARCSLRKEGHCEIAWAQMPYEEGARK